LRCHRLPKSSWRDSLCEWEKEEAQEMTVDGEKPRLSVPQGDLDPGESDRSAKMDEAVVHRIPSVASLPENYELRILQSIRRIIRAVDIHSRKLFSTSKLTGPQLLSLITIAENGPLTSVDLGKQIYLSPSTIVGILDRLEQKELVSRTRDREDRRRVFVEVTPTGRKVVEDAPSPLQDRLAEALINLPDLERATIALSLERIVDLMEAGQIDAAPILETGPIANSNHDPAEVLKKPLG
jgi:DNA-binding MarR family transcriptional regulator